MGERNETRNYHNRDLKRIFGTWGKGKGKQDKNITRNVEHRHGTIHSRTWGSENVTTHSRTLRLGEREAKETELGEGNMDLGAGKRKY